MKSYKTEQCPVARREMKMDRTINVRLDKQVGNKNPGVIIEVSKIENKNLFHVFLGSRCYIIEPSYFIETPELLELIETPLFEVDE